MQVLCGLVLQGIYQQVAQYDFAFVLVEADFSDRSVGPVVDVYLFSFSCSDKVLQDLSHPGIEGMRLQMQPAFAHFHLSDIEHHIDECLHALGLSVDGFKGQVLFIIRADGFQNPFQWGINQCQRSAQFMADVDEKRTFSS